MPMLRSPEPYEGLAIVTSNSLDNIDEDILCRIDVLVEFPAPDAAAREAMWAKLLGKVKLDRADNIDVRSLAKEFDLCGADIVRSVRLAASIAVTEERSLDMDLLIAAAKERIGMRRG